MAFGCESGDGGTTDSSGMSAGMETGTGDTTGTSDTNDAESGSGTATQGDGDGDQTTGDGDGDPSTTTTTGDGDGDATTTTGDGDGDPTTTTGDGDGDPTTTTGDGDATTGDGDGDGDATTGDGDGDGDATTGDGDGDPTTGGDGDGDPTTGGDGDGDPTTGGDGDGDPTTGGDGDGDPGFCGDGVVNGTEECDDNGESAACNADCTNASCGDGTINATANEQCDDGTANGNGTSSCTSTCLDNVCGDSYVGPGESCDDGGTMGGDGCSAICAVETCGNMVVDPNEDCDDANMDDDDGCTSACLFPACGDGIVQATSNSEQCDDSNNVTETCDYGVMSCTVCDATCQSVDGATSFCGDGNTDFGNNEECDTSGESVNCDSDCTFYACGDGVTNVTAGEQCDDGNVDAGDGCDATCQTEGGGGGGIVECTVAGGQPLECEDGIDNDGDMLVDLDDPECTTPCDDSEGTYITGLPGQNMDCKSDCYWDSDSGVGNDNCEWNISCDPLNPGWGDNCDIGCGLKGGVQTDPMACSVSTSCDPPNQPQSQTCLDVCEPLTPNGCDCFGCCEVQVDDGMGGTMATTIYLGNEENSCDSNTFGDCPTCTLQTDCYNECDVENCEICFGETEPPDECDEVGCTSGTLVACVDTADCVPDAMNGLDPNFTYFCFTGCCTAIPN